MYSTNKWYILIYYCVTLIVLPKDIVLLKDPSYVPDETNGMYILFLIIGIIGYFTIPTVSGWIVQAGSGGAMSRSINTIAMKGAAAGVQLHNR